MDKKKLLWVGDFLVTTGFARVNENVLHRFDPDVWDIHVMGINVSGDYHPLQARYKIYPASVHGSDQFGFARIGGMVEALHPDVIVFHQDAWNVASYIQAIKDHVRTLDPDGTKGYGLPPMIAYVPADAPNQPAGVLLNDLKLLIAPTQFGVDELVKGGYQGPTLVVPYGVDRTIYHPMPKREAREAMGFTGKMLDAFIVGRADRNATRKRYDLMLRYFADWLAGKPSADNAYLYLHCAPRDVGWDLQQLARYFGLEKRVLFTQGHTEPGAAGSEVRLAMIMNTWDLHLSTTLGEGFGLVALESMACGVPNALPRWSGYQSWASRGAFMLDCSNIQVHTQGLNTVGGVVSRSDVRDALTFFHDRPTNQLIWSHHATQLACQPQFSWDAIAATLEQECARVAA